MTAERGSQAAGWLAGFREGPLAALREAGIVTARADAQRRIYRLSDDGLDDIEAHRAAREGQTEGAVVQLEHAVDEADVLDQVDGLAARVEVVAVGCGRGLAVRVGID